MNRTEQTGEWEKKRQKKGMDKKKRIITRVPEQPLLDVESATVTWIQGSKRQNQGYVVKDSSKLLSSHPQAIPKLEPLAVAS